MNENINLCEILKDCPKGEKFYSYVYGLVEFIKVDPDNTETPIIIYVTTKRGYKTFKQITREGYLSNIYNNVKCSLVPSPEQPDWSKWKCPKPKKPKFDPKTLKAFDKVLVRASNLGCHCWYGDFVNLQSQGNKLPCVLSDKDYKMIIPYNDDTKHLIGTTDEAPEYYRYWEN